ncbi:AraC family transcriptional regulator [Streptomyces sp. ST2-7A]|nr:AraC family transcriptional regulator [Streptomyces sp. ST2-7A]MCE7082691.1 AraC family transcriptional regulator [Streptomyces sp. ST2-7A]
MTRDPGLAGVREVLRAHLVDHAYPLHVHDTWTVLLIDDGVVRYELDRRTHAAPTPLVTLLPPHVPHNGAPTGPTGLRKRVLYLEEPLLGADLIGPAVDRPGIADPLLRSRLHRLHLALDRPGEDLEAETRLAFVVERLRARWLRPSADRLRALLHARVREGVTLTEAAELLGAHPTHLVRAFTRRVGMPPHAYLVTLRVDLARRLLLEGCPPAEVAVLAGFHDQPHLTRHFRRILGLPPGRWLRGGG